MSKKVLLYSSAEHKPAPDQTFMHLCTNGWQLQCTSNLEEALELAASQDFSIGISNAPVKAFFAALKAPHLESPPAVCTILLTDLPMDQYSPRLGGQEDILLDVVIANHLPKKFTLHEMRVTLQKIIRDDYFGMEKYLLPDCKIHQGTLKGSVDRARYNEKIHNFAEQYKLGGYMSRLAFGIAEELMMNAIYDAPHESGKNEYANFARTEQVILQPADYSTIRYAFDGHLFAISVEDPFGALKRDKFAKYLRKIIHRRDGGDFIDTKQIGAGLGLFKILHSCHSLICNVRSGKCTEVIAIIDIDNQIRDFSRMPRSIQYFQID